MLVPWNLASVVIGNRAIDKIPQQCGRSWHLPSPGHFQAWRLPTAQFRGRGELEFLRYLQQTTLSTFKVTGLRMPEGSSRESLV